jgi:hypothetical protein
MNSESGSGDRDKYVDLDPEKVEDGALGIANEEGRYEATEFDRDEARQELLEPVIEDESAEELIDETDRPDAGVAPVSSGTKIERVPLEDEINVVEELVREGIEEADDNTRHHSGSNREL